jgi:hypothetical protein
MADELQARDLAVLPVDELALWLMQQMLAEAGPTFRRIYVLDKVLKRLGERMPGDSAYQRGAAANDAPHLAKALGEAWDWLSANGLIAEAVTGMLRGQMPLEGYVFVTRLGNL